MKRIINFLKDNRLYFICFLVALIVINFVYYLNDVSPYGDKSLLCIDFYHQYGPMLGELYDRIHNSSNFIYSFNMAMGLPFFRNFLNYLSSPFNIIMLFFSHDGILTSFSFIIGLKAVMSSCTMVYYLSKKFNSKNLYLIPLGIIYAFSAYFQAYYWNIMWLDGMVFLPLITLGIENIVNKNKWKLYTFSLAIMLLANYFIGYMICIFSCVYFIGYFIYKLKIRKQSWFADIKFYGKKIMIFGISSLLAGLLTAFLLLPMFSSLTSISATGDAFQTTRYYPFELIDFLKAHFSGVNLTVFASDEIKAPNISCGILSIALIFAYLINLDIPLKNKICYILILSFFILAFFYAPLDYIIHAFHVPNDLPYRYSFLYSFVLVIICAYSIKNIKKIKYPLLIVAYLFLMALMLTISKDKWPNLTENMIYINMILLTLYFIFYLASNYFIKYKKLFYGAIIFVSMIDVIVSLSFNWDITQNLKGFYADYNSTEELLDYVKMKDDEPFYRIEQTTMMTLNDPSWYNYYGMTTFSSMAYERMAILQHNLGIPGNVINSYYYTNTTPIYDMMFDIKYFIGENNDEKHYEEVYRNEKTVNKHKYNVGLMYGTNKSLKNWEYDLGNPFQIQNDFIEKSTGIKNTLEEATIINTEDVYLDDDVIILKYRIENNNNNLYFYTNDVSIDYFIIDGTMYYKNDNYTDALSYSKELDYNFIIDYNEEKIINIKPSEKNKETIIYIAYNAYFDPAFKIYQMNNKKFVDAYNVLNKNKVNITKFKESLIEGNINADVDKIIYTSIPYDKGWKVYIDGKETKAYPLGDALLAFDITTGNHKIRLKYQIPYFAFGVMVSGSTIIGLLIYSIYERRKKISNN